MTEQLTHTSMTTARACLRRYWYRYRLGLVRQRTARALRMGGAVHLGLAEYSLGHAEFADLAIREYDVCPPWADPHAWEVERETVWALLLGYAWWYGTDGDPLTYVGIEQSFEIPLVNPETDAESRTWRLAGKRDGLAQWDGRLFVLERKTSGEDIGPESEYWLRLRIDPQITLYAIAARAEGHDVAGVLYDVIRKPTISPRQIPALDEDGLKIVVDSNGERVFLANGKPRQSADSARGWTLVSRIETPQEFGERLAADIRERPEYYYKRREIPLLHDQEEEFRADTWNTGQILMLCQRRNLWPRNVSRMTCGYCDFAELCLHSVRVEPGTVPAGYDCLDDMHPELGEEEEAS